MTSSLVWTTVKVPPLDLEGRIRLDVWLTSELTSMSRSKVQSMIEMGLVRVNGIKVTSGKDGVKENDVVSYSLPKRESTHLEPVAMKLNVIFEDDSILVVNKPAGISVHPGAGDQGPTLAHGLLAHAKKLGFSEAIGFEDDSQNDRPGIVHRLDKDTTGLLVVAKTDAAHAHLSRQFHDKTNFRQYVALLNGVMPEGEWVRESWLYRDPRDRTKFASMDLDEYLKKRDKSGKDPAGFKFSKSLFKREADFCGLVSLCSVRLYTGRTHQIRIHAKDMGCPIIGDQTYGVKFRADGSQNGSVFETLLSPVTRQMLHAWVLGFEHPETGEWVQFEAPPPRDFSDLVQQLREIDQKSQ